MSPENKGRKPRSFEFDDPDLRVSKPPPGPDPDISGADQAATTERGKGHEAAEESDGLGSAEVGASAQPPEGTGSFSGLGVFISAVVGLAGLALSLWYTRFVSEAVLRDDWIGWIARGFAAIILAGLAYFVLRELLGYLRLNRLGRLRSEANRAQTDNDFKLAQRAVRRLKSHVGAERDARWALDRFRENERHMRDAASLLGLADRVLLEKPDAKAREIIYQSARRVGVVTAVVPITFIVMTFVLLENLRMVRRLAGAYGGQPGFFGGLRLFSWIIGHIAATGAIALTDDLWGQFFGQDVLRRVSSKLGEGAFNGALTARLGVAALSICRPLPFIEAKPPRARNIIYQAFPDLRPELVKRVWRTGGSDKR
ncbi:MAG: TIGR01620 family protein [Alphaproteobacteria bacterium]|nr:TIGR01620 family protein [Alphaproteobacteria bacterium]